MNDQPFSCQSPSGRIVHSQTLRQVGTEEALVLFGWVPIANDGNEASEWTDIESTVEALCFEVDEIVAACTRMAVFITGHFAEASATKAVGLGPDVADSCLSC